MSMELDYIPASEPHVPDEANVPATMPKMSEPVAWLVAHGRLGLEEAQRVDETSGGGKDPLAGLKGRVSNADLHEAACRTGHAVDVAQLSDLPEWTVVLNDVDGPLGGGERNLNLAIIANEKEARRGQPRCFVVCTQKASKQDVAMAVTAVLGSRLALAGKIQVPEQLLGVLYGEWDGQGRKSFVKQDDGQADLHAVFDALSEDAIALNASDIHIRSTGHSASIKFRVDGKLEHYKEVTAEHAMELVSSVYNTLSEASSVNKSFIPSQPLDSVVERSLKPGKYRFRFSNLPMAPAGFDVTLRIAQVGVAAKRQSASELGYSPDQEHALDRMFAKSSGLIVFAGITGSGKTTSVANFIRKVAEENPGKKIRTVEEPVEIMIPGVSQHPVTRIHGDQRDFLVMLRQMLRSDPDVMMIGEVRDLDTAQLAIQSVRTGHLCITTIHVDGAPNVYDRLVAMGIPRMDLAGMNLISGLVFQKLVPVLCPSCRVSAQALDIATLSLQEVERLDRAAQVNGGSLAGIYVRSKDGCGHCRNRGISGRTVCAEILRPTNEMLTAIVNGDSRELWRMWRATINRDDAADMTGRTAFEHAIFKMKQGWLSPEDIENEFHYLDEAVFEGGDP